MTYIHIINNRQKKFVIMSRKHNTLTVSAFSASFKKICSIYTQSYILVAKFNITIYIKITNISNSVAFWVKFAICKTIENAMWSSRFPTSFVYIVKCKKIQLNENKCYTFSRYSDNWNTTNMVRLLIFQIKFLIFKELNIFLWKKRRFQLCRDLNPGLSIAGVRYFCLDKVDNDIWTLPS